MKNYIINILIIVICLKTKISYTKIVQFNFKRYPYNIININSLIHHSKNNNNNKYSIENDYIFRLFSDDAYLNLTMGSPIQVIPTIWNMNKHSFKIYSNSYNYKQSITFKNISDKFIYSFDEISEAKISQDIFYFNDNNNISLSVNNFEFVLINNNQKNYSFIGLQLPGITTNDLLTFTKEMKKNKIIDKYIFFILYSKNDNYYENSEGVLYFGDYPHNINIINDKYNLNINNYYEIKAAARNKLAYWDILFDNIYFDNEYIDIKYKQAEIIGNMQLSVGTEEYYQFIKKNFFNEYIGQNICEEKIILNITDYSYYKCQLNKQFDISKFPTLIFELKEINFNFSLNYNDLFFIHDKYIYFGILFDRYFPLKINQRWKLGAIILKKYFLVFNQDSKTIGLYNNIINNGQNIYDKTENQFNDMNKKNIFIKIIKVLGIIILFVIIFILYRFIKRKRNKLNEKNELLDNKNYTKKKLAHTNSKSKNEIHIYYELSNDLIGDKN